MVSFHPLMPIPLVVVYLCVTSSTLVLCLLSFVAIYRTKKTPYGTKILSMGLLTYDSLFLVVSSVSKMFDYDDIFVLSHITRGFQLATLVIVCCMSLERLFVLNWPYVYLRVVTNERTRAVCLGIFFISFIQYVAFRGLFCYARNKAINCGWSVAVYFVLVSVLFPAVSFISYIKIYRIVRSGEKRTRIRQYKGTVASFSLLVSTTFTWFVTVGLSVLYFIRTARGVKENGMMGTLADWFNLINCVVDPLIYVVWFRETRMELMKLCNVICPTLKPKIEKMRVEIFHVNQISGKFKPAPRSKYSGTIEPITILNTENTDGTSQA